MPNICNGCGRDDFRRGFRRHLRYSADERCIAYALRLGVFNVNAAKANRHPSPNPSTPPDPPSGVRLNTDPAGDFFGNYDDLQDDIDIVMAEPPVPGPLSDEESEEDDDDDDDYDDYAAAAANCENGWEPPVIEVPSRSPSPEIILPLADDEVDAYFDLPPPLPPHHANIPQMKKPFVVHYPDPRVGRPVANAGKTTDEDYRTSLGGGDNPWAPYTSEIDWGVARWAKLRGPSSNALVELLKIPGLVEKLGLSFKNANELHSIIDTKLPSHRPRFQVQEVIVQGEAFPVYFRDIIECVRALLGDSEYLPYLKFAPEQHYSDAAHTKRLYYDMHTGTWWWSTQEKIDEMVGPGGTVIPIIISSDKTQVTVFRNKSVYPLYLTIGNIPKEIRRKPSSRAYILLGYLPTARLDHITNQAARRRCLGNLFHACMRIITAPLERPGRDGIIMTSGDGIQRRGHPILAIYVGDYPEQILVTCCITGDCPVCQVPRLEVGEDAGPHPMRRLASILDALAKIEDGAGAFLDACKEVRIKPIFDPFWASLPFSHIFRAITPDVLHQLYQGVFKHLKAWAFEAYGAAELDARCRRLPPNHNIRLFLKGIGSLSRVTGQEHDQMARFFLGLVIGARLPGGMSSIRLVRCIRALLDFLFLAQFPSHSDDTLALLEDAQLRFHANKSIFIDLNIRENFQIPKLHFLEHYAPGIRLFGTLDNCNTENTERLHIDLAKEAYRATNKKDEYPQMTLWLERKEKILRHDKYIQWRLAGGHVPPRVPWISPALGDVRTLKMTKHPSSTQVRIKDLPDRFGIPFFAATVARFILQLRTPTLNGARLKAAVNNFNLPTSSILPFYRMKFVHTEFFTGTVSTADSIHAKPLHVSNRGESVPARFDTALVNILDPGHDDAPPTRRLRVGQVRLIFSFPSTVQDDVFSGIPEERRPRHMAYIEWFTRFGNHPDPVHGLHKISRCEVNGGTLSSIVDIRCIERSVHLFPRFGAVAPPAPKWYSCQKPNIWRTPEAPSELDIDEWLSLYHLASMWLMEEVKKRAISKVNHLALEVHPTRLIQYGRAFKRDDWVLYAYKKVVRDLKDIPDHISNALGLRTTVKLQRLMLEKVRSELESHDVYHSRRDTKTTPPPSYAEIFKDEICDICGDAPSDSRETFPRS